MEHKRLKSPEEWGDEALGQFASNGNLQIYRNFSHLIIKVFATYVWVFLRYRFGVYVVNLRSIWWGGMVLMLLGMISSLGQSGVDANGQPVEPSGSPVFYGWHLALFILAAFYHSFEANRNLRRTDGKGQLRNGYDTGESRLWLWLEKLVHATGFIETRVGHWLCARITYFRLQKWLEPLLIVGIGILFRMFGYEGYGLFLILCGISVHLVARMEERAYYEFKQQHWDAQVTTGAMPGAEPASTPRRGMATPPAAPRKPENAFEQWKKDRAAKPDFETAQTPEPEIHHHAD
jgi:hypothetical protein